MGMNEHAANCRRDKHGPLQKISAVVTSYTVSLSGKIVETISKRIKNLFLGCILIEFSLQGSSMNPQFMGCGGYVVVTVV